MLAKPALWTHRVRSNAALKSILLRKQQFRFKHGSQRQLPTNSLLLRPHLKQLSRRPTLRPHTHRTFLTSLTSSTPTVVLPPLVFLGLLVTLWTYKCLMMVLFQDKIIYMPYMPPFARSEKIEDYAAACRPVEWEERQIRSLDGTRLAVCVGRMSDGGRAGEGEDDVRKKEVVICYFQGNGGSLPPRLPVLSSVLKAVHARSTAKGISVRYTLLALSYRGYWTSSGRARQSGVESDAQALLQYVTTHLLLSGTDTELILWGQSIGAGVATTATATYLSKNQEQTSGRPKIEGLVLETPFTSTKNMLIALYPQKWLPYRYLYPFLWNRWDSEVALRKIAASGEKLPSMLLVPAAKDELVPADEANNLERIGKELGFLVERKDVEGALHNETTIRRDGQESISRFVVDMVSLKI